LIEDKEKGSGVTRGAGKADCPGQQSGGSGKKDGKMGIKGGIRHLMTFGVAKLQSSPGADNPHYAIGKGRGWTA